MTIGSTARAFALCLAATLGACTWVRLTEQGKGVRMVQASEAESCRKIGYATAQTTDRFAIFARTDRKIDEEIGFLARNEAAKMGGNAIVPSGARSDGRQAFEVYRCP
jgi:hypothetical protein